MGSSIQGFGKRLPVSVSHARHASIAPQAGLTHQATCVEWGRRTARHAVNSNKVSALSRLMMVEDRPSRIALHFKKGQSAKAGIAVGGALRRGEITAANTEPVGQTGAICFKYPTG